MTAQCALRFDGDTAPSDSLPVFNALSYDGGRCQICSVRRQQFYLSCYSRSGAHLPNRFVCAVCLPAVEAQARGVGHVDKFEVDAA